ncbi:hypothetical protein PFICI_11969 [Pestalotiopsis fici W106-1]|uniref:Cytochrome P450 n=1 Tax=Pestalotiopsis fici (strain W106-1 / CGMCC3.15140) TaxID=1229662 RepID=W3WTT0_PESFW|nr:uncharacterized protein PFICI_11969 [Pestalotiopsis fici W106-1]ETS76582.1 hypothetical protein PFICI_11969 [Pestalotiopsis fici W106-1]
MSRTYPFQIPVDSAEVSQPAGPGAIPEPYSMLFGHIPLLMALKKGLPSDAHDTYPARRLGLDWRDYFPKATTAPPLAYLDLWPFLSQPLIWVYSPQACAQLTQENPQPRHSLFKWSLTPLTGGKDLTCVDMAEHKVWRSRLNPGFSSMNLMSQMDMLLEEVVVFTKNLEKMAGEDGSWGNPFPFYDQTVPLTFDIIIRSTLDYPTHEQTQGPSPLLQSIRQLIQFVKKPNLASKLERWLPAYRYDVSRHTSIINNIMVPHIQSRIGREREPGRRKTVVDLCLKNIPTSTKGIDISRQRLEYIDVVLSQVKVFVLAGHHTTAQAICWLLYDINTNPAVLERIQSEHDELLGSDPNEARNVLSTQPYKLKDLRYTSAVIKESLRIHALGQTHREGSANFSFYLEGILYPTDDSILQTVPTVTQVSPDIWPRASEFLPERFLVSPGHDLYPPKNAWRPFELGTTRCIGEELAMIEMQLVLALTSRHIEYKFGHGEGSDASW